MTLLDNFTNPMDQFNQRTYRDVQEIFDAKLQQQTANRRLGNKYHRKLKQVIDAYDFYNKLMARVIDNPKYAVRDATSVAE